MDHISSRLSLTIFLCLLVLLCGTSSARMDDAYGYCDSDIFGIMDHHYGGVLFPEVYKSLAGTKIRYPGLWTEERNSFTAGVQPGRFSGDGGGLAGLYAWTDIDNGPGTAGVWVGEFNYGSEFRAFLVRYDSIYFMDASVFTLRGAVWITPFRSKAFRGLSVTVDINNVFAYDGNPYQDFQDIKKVYVNVTSLIMLTDSYHLRAGVKTYNKQAEDPQDTRFDNSKKFTDGVFVGLIDDKRRTLDFRVDNSYGALYSGDKSDTLTFSLAYTQGGALSYMKHLLFLGIKADASLSYPSIIGENTGTFKYGEYLDNLTSKGRVMRLTLTAPTILDIQIYGSLRGMLSVSPQIDYKSIALKGDQHLLEINIPQAELSLRGTIGESFDFALKPTISNDVFISALEARYRF